MKIAVVTVLAALALAPAATARPNVLLIVTDDQRWDTLAYMPTVQAELQAKGVTFANSFTVNPLCCPSRAAILTGTWSHTNGVWGNGGENRGGYLAFDDSWTLPVWLDAAGYETMMAGKYINGYDERFAPASYLPPGWDRWFAYWGSPVQAYFDYRMTEGGDALSFGDDDADYATDVLASRAVDFIRSSTTPFFLYFAPKAPHWSGAWFNVDPAPRHVDAFAGMPEWQRPNVNEADVSDKPWHVRRRSPLNADILAEFREEQLESLLAVDEAIAQMLAALEETGKLADTLIMFTSDNGHSWGEHRWPEKTVPYEESLRVPLVVRYDPLAVPGRVVSQFALNVDLAPTIMAAGGAKVAGTEGRSFLPLLTGTARWRESFLFEHANRPSRVPSYCGFRTQRWKYVQYATGEEELYDLPADPYELRNLRAADRRRALTMSFRARLRRSECRPPLFGRPLPLCTKQGTRGRDFLRGTRKRDWICAGRGRDRINVRRGGRDVVRCGSGFDRVRADKRDVLIACERRSRKRIPR